MSNERTLKVVDCFRTWVRAHDAYFPGYEQWLSGQSEEHRAIVKGTLLGMSLAEAKEGSRSLFERGDQYLGSENRFPRHAPMIKQWYKSQPPVQESYTAREVPVSEPSAERKIKNECQAIWDSFTPEMQAELDQYLHGTSEALKGKYTKGQGVNKTTGLEMYYVVSEIPSLERAKKRLCLIQVGIKSGVFTDAELKYLVNFHGKEKDEQRHALTHYANGASRESLMKSSETREVVLV